MRLLLAGTAKTGNVWIENILARIYELRILEPPNVPSTSEADFEEFCNAERFADDSIFHQHFVPTERFFEIVEKVNCRVLTAIRNPYDIFVSLYFYIQNFRADFVKAADPGAVLIDRPIDDPIVLEFLKYTFDEFLRSACRWVGGGKSIIVRYEDLHADPFAAISRITNLIQPRAEQRIRDAIAESSADVLRKQDPVFARHIRKGTVGDWRNHLTEQHLAIFREWHRDAIEYLGYAVIEEQQPRASGHCASASIGGTLVA